MKRGLALLAIGFLLTGCVTVPADQRVDYDPLEPLNRGIYGVNDAVDRATLKPLAKGYNKVVPEPVRNGITNFSRNLFTPRSAINNFLQGKPGNGFSELMRFAVNSTVGIGGLVDIAAHLGVEEKTEDFGQTAAVWGVPQGPYVVIPFLGPSTLRDAVMMPLDVAADPLYHYDDKQSVRNSLYAMRLVNLRARVLSIEELLADSADPYVTIRESYLQNREFQIYDGDPPLDDDEFYDEFLEEEDY
ncbi:MAG: VacJ family lipoprotein [Woeseiaceae bacterium]|nr:VacJ family lipoprotein [Woeseiaceae bacterium]